MKVLETTQAAKAGQDKVMNFLRRQFQQGTNTQNEAEATKGRKSKDAGAGHTAALVEVRSALLTTTHPEVVVTEIQQSFVAGTFKWLAENDIYKRFAEGEEPIVWVMGERGLGKSNLAFHTLSDLQERVSRSTVAGYFFQEEHEELRSITNFLKYVVVQVAIKDTKYREEIAVEIQKNADELAGDDGTLIWEKFIASKFSPESDTRLFIVVDGVEEMDPEARKKLYGLLDQIKKDSLQISVLATSRHDPEESLKSTDVPGIAMTMDLIKKDVKLIIRARMKQLSKLRRLRAHVKKRVVSKLSQKADSEFISTLLLHIKLTLP